MGLTGSQRQKKRHRSSIDEVRLEADSALRVVRVILGVLATFIVAGYSPLESDTSLPGLLVTIGSIAAVTATLNFASTRLIDGNLELAMMQALDIAGAIGLAVVLDEPSAHTSWALLIVPVVSASVRLNATAVIASWASGSLGYMVADQVGWLRPSGSEELYVQVSGIMLAVAVALGMLARWMREGWEIQRELTMSASERERRLATLEAASRQMTNSSERIVLKICTERVVDLGFEAATAHRSTDRSPYVAIGDGRIVSDVLPDFAMEADTAVVTLWNDGQSVRSTSAAVLEPKSGVVLTGWRAGPISSDLAETMVALVAQASAAVEAARIVARLRTAASRDPLTGTLNRRALDHTLRRCAAGDGRIGFVLVDLDGFKQINDTYGHPVGDHVLTISASRLASVVGEGGVLARYGGDEFAIVLPAAEMEHMDRLGDRLLSAARTPISAGQATVRLGMSVGIAVAEAPCSPADLIAAADRALYRAKEDGRDRAVVAELGSVETTGSSDDGETISEQTVLTERLGARRR